MSGGSAQQQQQQQPATNEGEPSTSTATTFGDVTYVRKVGAGLGITPAMLPETAVQELNNNVTYLLRNVITGAVRFAQHSRRTRVMPDDVDAHLAHERKPALFGLKPRDLIAMRLQGTGGREIFVDDDKEIELNSIYTAQVPKVPAKTYIKAHWLAIDGEQPAVPENPIPKVKDVAFGGSTTESSNNHVDDAQEDANRLLNIVRGTKVTEQVNVKTTTTHTLSLEQQVYYKEITEAMMGSDDQKRTEALHSLKTDAGIQPLLSRFSIAIAEGVRCNIVQHNLAFLIYLMRMVQGLVSNPTVSLEKCLHELLPSVLSCVLSRQVCSRPETDNHWALREFGGRILAELCKKHNVMDVQTRVIEVLQQVWIKPTPSLSTLYGSLYALNEFGLDTVKCVAVPHIPTLHSRLVLAVGDRTDLGERVAADRLLLFTQKVMITYVRAMRPPNLVSYQDYVDAFGGFAETMYRVLMMETQQGRGGMTASRPAVQRSASQLLPQQQQSQQQSQQQQIQRMVSMSGVSASSRPSSAYSTPVQSRSATPVSRQIISNGTGSGISASQIRYTTSTSSNSSPAVRRPVTNQAPPTSRPQ